MSAFAVALAEKAGRSCRTVSVTISGLPGRAAFDRFLDLLGILRWVEKPFHAVRYADGQGYVGVPYAEKTIYLAGMLNFRSDYEVDSYSWDSLHVRYRGK